MTNTPLFDKLNAVRDLLVQASDSRKSVYDARELAKAALSELGGVPKAVRTLEETMNSAMDMVQDHLTTAPADPLPEVPAMPEVPELLEDVKVEWEDDNKSGEENDAASERKTLKKKGFFK